MFQLIFVFAIVLIIIIYPVMLAARLFGAGNTGAGAVVFALFLQVIAGILLRLLISNEIAIGLIAILVGSMIYAYALDTTIPRGFGISILAALIAVVLVFLFAGIASVVGIPLQ